MMISTTMIAIADARMYVSVFDATGAAVGVEVATACITAKPSSAYDGQYPLVPWNVAMTL